MNAFRLFLHVLSASVWVGGQIALAWEVPAVRTLGADATVRAARAFQRVAWPAYGLAVVTGMWNLVALPLADLQHPWIELKVLAVLLSGGGAAVHQVARQHRGLLAVGGAASLGFGVAAMYLGFLVTPVP